MKTITIEELEALKDAEKTIVDIRPQDQYMRGTFPGAVSLPASRLEEQYEEETARLDKMHPVYVMCHTGEKSQEWVRRLTGDGFDAVNVEGGYRAWLRLSLSRFVGGESEADREEKRARIEQSIIKNSASRSGGDLPRRSVSTSLCRTETRLQSVSQAARTPC